ncbi:hypothetical protein [Neisseria arctica]|uniref:hypothetical protein n=1 Tax=Neisseria arctica TaxID=1470200 RepID=UPI000A5F9205|nr:hypothetical protein [Neisseria arctica]UOO87528.1 hypothetical protein LVJ86_04590 [Neisseria arctica]
MTEQTFNKAEYLNAILAEDSYSDHKHRINVKDGKQIVRVIYPDGEVEEFRRY